MGANAQTAVPAFTAGQVLTAAQQTQINTGVPVFATTVTRDAAFDGAGEKTLAEGQFAYIEATNSTQYYDGAAWVAVGASGLTLISTATFSAVSTYSLPTNSFTSTYSNYLLFLNLTTSTNSALNFRYRVAGTDYSGATYQNCGFTVTTGGTIANDGISGANQTSAKAGYIGNGSADSPTVTLTILRPNEAIETRYTSFIPATNNGSTLAAYSIVGGTVYQTTQYDSLTFIPSAANIAGTYYLYGYAKS
jgi:hypothetical protein